MSDCSCHRGDPIGCLVHSPLSARNQRPVPCPDCLKLVTNRDCQIIALRAERDRLAGVVERVKDLHRWLKESGTHANEALNLGNVLAEPVGSRCDLDECSVGRNPGSQHGYGKCVERRKGERRCCMSSCYGTRFVRDRRGKAGA